MEIFVDASTQDQKSAAGVVVINQGIIIKKTGEAFIEKDPHTAELNAIILGMQTSVQYPSSHIVYSDSKSVVDKVMSRDSQKYAILIRKTRSYMESHNIELLWIPRRFNKIANGLSRMMLSDIDWQEEITMGNRLEVRYALTPMHWSVENHTVSIHDGVFKCTCSLSKYLSRNKMNCRHIHAVKKRMNIINEHGEGILMPFSEVSNPRDIVTK